MTTEEAVKIVPENRRDKVFCSFTKMMPIGELKENPKNANYHDREQIEILANAIKNTGWRTPIGISSRSGYIVRGHGRFAAAKALGLTEVPVDVQHYDSESQELADLLADNKIADLGQTEYDKVSGILKGLEPGQLAFTGFRDFEIVPLMMAEWVKPALADMPESSIALVKFSTNEAQAETIRKSIKIVQSKSVRNLSDGECLEIIANHFLGKVIKEEQVATPVKLSEDLPKPIKPKTVEAIAVAPTPTTLIDTVGAPRLILIERVTSTLWQDIDAHVIVSVEGARFYVNDEALIVVAKSAAEKKEWVKIKVDQKGKDFWVTSLELAPVAQEKANVNATA